MRKWKQPEHKIELIYHYCPECQLNPLFSDLTKGPMLSWSMRTELCPECHAPMATTHIRISGTSAGLFIDELERRKLFFSAYSGGAA